MRKIAEEEIMKRVNAFMNASEQVLELYEKNDGEPDGKPIECPMCEKETLQYACHWYGNKHVHLHCTSCEWTAMQ